ncbi:flagellar basal body P-ring protein FlgI [Yunchengibacter salinarum]|uniref:flagellar basal body P-ring protein FlgI n=1 Tax=Yunchengibacter salinarum TaxID=3133399 RepID=UPI0035B647E9
MMVAALVVLTGASQPGMAASRIKDIVSVEGVRENQLIGYGLVVGLNGSGDTLRNSPFTEQSLNAMLERLGVNTKGVNMRPENIAAVMVTANLPAFARHGSRIDVTVSSMGDAEDLKGGNLLVTPLMGADGEVYAVAQGNVAVAGFNVQGEAASIVRGVPTNGRIANGATVERELPFELNDLNNLKLQLRNPDLTTAKRIAKVINDGVQGNVAETLDPATVQLTRPVGYPMSTVDLLADIENLMVEPSLAARVVIDERTGIIVMGQEVRISPVAIAQGNLTIQISETPVASQPGPLAEGGETEVLPRTQIDVDDDSDKKLTVLDEAVTLQELVDGLNALGIGPRDMISILQALKTAGALQAEIRTM